MCGIAGYFGKRGDTIEQNIPLTLSLMRNRGPDCQDFKILSNNNGLSVILLHSRLSIIDLKNRANQPFSKEGCHLIFNGEIYNYQELSEDLKRKGHSFQTTSDTEVLLHAYLEYGKDCVNYFEGMWAFVIYDQRDETIFISRDRFREKPLYIYNTDHGFFFASETSFIRSLTNETFKVNKKKLLTYLIKGYRFLKKEFSTFYEGIEELPWAYNLEVDRNLNIKKYRYWTPKYEPQDMSLQEAINGTKEKFIKSVEIRLRSDVPLACRLSGGVDSSAIIAVAKKIFNCDIAAFSIIDHDSRYNELDNIQANLDDLQCNGKLIYTTTENFLPRLKKLIKYHDAPISTISYYIHSFLCESIQEEGFRVALSGTSGDELFAGYYDHFLLQLYELKDSPYFEEYLKAWKKHIKPIVRNPYLQDPEVFIKNLQFREHLLVNSDMFKDLLRANYSDEEFYEDSFCSSLMRNRMLNELFYEATPVILYEDDLNSMMHSIENRSPFLDTELLHFALSIPPQYLIVDGMQKYVLREAMKGIVNDKVRLDRQKKGFNASITSLVDFENKDTEEFLFSSSSPIGDILNLDKLKELTKQKPIPNSISKFLFNFINCKIFLDMQ